MGGRGAFALGSAAPRRTRSCGSATGAKWRAGEQLLFGRLRARWAKAQCLERGVSRHVIGVVDPIEHGRDLVLDRRDEGRERVTRRAQLIDLHVQRLALHRQIVQDRLARFVGLFEDGAALLATALDERFAVDLRRVDEALRGQTRVVLYGGRGRLGLSDQRRRALLGLHEMGGAALLTLGEDQGTSFLRLGRDAPGLLVRGTKDGGTLGPQRAGQGRLIERRVRRAPLGLAQLVLEFSDPALEVAHLARDGLELDADLARVVTPLAQRREVHPGDFGRGLARG